MQGYMESRATVDNRWSEKSWKQAARESFISQKANQAATLLSFLELASSLEEFLSTLRELRRVDSDERATTYVNSLFQLIYSSHPPGELASRSRIILEKLIKSSNIKNILENEIDDENIINTITKAIECLIFRYHAPSH
jgi:hypothetical protein